MVEFYDTRKEITNRIVQTNDAFHFYYPGNQVFKNIYSLIFI